MEVSKYFVEDLLNGDAARVRHVKDEVEGGDAEPEGWNWRTCCWFIYYGGVDEIRG